MKKILPVFLILILLCGCKKSKPEYLISAIGFDYKNGQYETVFEAVISNSETDEQTVKLIKGIGNTIEKSIEKIARQSTQEILLSHCGVIVVGESVPQNRLDEIYKYCLENDDITLSALFVKSENAQKLLSQKPISTISVGYDIVGLIESRDKKIKNRYFEIMAKDEKEKLPKIKVMKEGYYLVD